MVEVHCEDDDCEGIAKHVPGSTDSRDEWTEETYECPECGAGYTHRTEYDQNGIVTSDEVYPTE